MIPRWLREIRARGGCRLTLLFMSSALVVLSMQSAMAQVTTGTITGVVVARDGGQPVIDATVAVEGTNLTAVANGVGRFRLEGVPPGQVVIVATGPGFLQLRVPDVRVTSNDATSLIVELEHTPNIMERVQVTATKTRTEHRRRRRADGYRDPLDNRRQEPSVAGAGRLPCAWCRRCHTARHVRIGAAARHASRRQRVHEHAAADRWSPAGGLAQLGTDRWVAHT